MKFIFKLMTQTQIGKLFGVTSHVVGDWLRTIGLRDPDGKPTQKAQDGGFCDTAPSGTTGYHWVWTSEKTVSALIKAGHSLICNPPHNLVPPSILNGPFSARKSKTTEFVVENGDGSVSVWANNKATAEVLAQILNMAHNCGAIERLCKRQMLQQMPSVPMAEIEAVIAPFEG
jgi:hypothetical protein